VELASPPLRLSAPFVENLLTKVSPVSLWRLHQKHAYRCGQASALQPWWLSAKLSNQASERGTDRRGTATLSEVSCGLTIDLLLSTYLS
jgi:hypothetical protein